MHNGTEPAEAKCSLDERARLRRNQRNSRARKQEYIQDLERRWADCVKQGVQASAELQKEARRVHEENKALRDILREMGLSGDELQQRLELITSSTQCGLTNGVSTAQSSLIKPTPLAPISNINSEAASEREPPSAHDQMITPAAPAAEFPMGSTATQPLTFHRDQMEPDAPQLWDLYSWLNELSNVKDAFGVEAQLQFDYNDPTSPTSAVYPVSRGTEPTHVLPNEGCIDSAPWVPDHRKFMVNNRTSSTDADIPTVAGSQGIEEAVSHSRNSTCNKDLLNFSYYSNLGNGIQ